MTEQPPPPPAQGMTTWAVDVLRSLNINNVLTIALLAVVAAPSYFAWRFMTDTEFRHEFTSSTEVIDAGVPCLVLQGNAVGQGMRTTIGNSYDIRNRLEYLIAIRSPGLMTDAEIKVACDLAHAETDLIRAAHAAQSKE